jgi:hypothetical protein
MRNPAQWTPWLAAIALGLLAACLLARSLWLSWQRRRRLRGQVLDAQASERAAVRLVEKSGYRVESTQVSRQWTLWANGEPLHVRLRADMILRKGKQRFVADVKLGQQASQLRTIATRRQLLEYRMAYDVDGVLLIDMAREAIVRVEFALPARNPEAVALFQPRTLAWAIAIAATLVATVQWLQLP